MLIVLIANPIALEPETKSPKIRPNVLDSTLQKGKTLRSTQILNESICEEKTRLFKLIAWMVFLLVLPPLLTLLYIVLIPDAFTTDVTPMYDFSNWTPGQRPNAIAP